MAEVLTVAAELGCVVTAVIGACDVVENKVFVVSTVTELGGPTCEVVIANGIVGEFTEDMAACGQ